VKSLAIIQICLLTLLTNLSLNSQSIVPTVYLGLGSHNAIGHLAYVRNDIAAINFSLGLEGTNTRLYPQITAGYGFCKSNLPNNLHYFPVGIGLGIGGMRFRVEPAAYCTPVFGKYFYSPYNISYSVEKSFTYCFTFELLFKWYGKKGFYAHAGLGYKYMPEKAIPVPTEDSDNFYLRGFSPTIGIGYSLRKGTFTKGINPDSVSTHTRKNVIGIELFGSNFFDINSNNVSIAAVSYTRRLFVAKQCFQVGLGISVSQGKSYDQAGGKQTNALLSIPSRLLWRMNYKRNGLWFGFYVTPAFGKQHYLISTRGGFIDSYKNFNFQGGPELSYQFHSRNDQFVFALSVSTKIMNAIASSEFGSSKILPVYGGISIGRAF
jgi:hypothetical protein